MSSPPRTATRGIAGTHDTRHRAHNRAAHITGRAALGVGESSTRAVESPVPQGTERMLFAAKERLQSADMAAGPATAAR
eukprot:scaffold86999_cov35-Phaeocystis_antarctica.AAC.3